jgi:ribosomal protein S12 methylthiotransferase accessory factor
VTASYSLAELLPRRRTGPGYKVPGEMGESLAKAFELSFSLLERSYGRLSVRPPSKVLTPRWLRVCNQLVRRGLARKVTLSLPLERGVPIYYFDIAAAFLGHETDGGRPQLSRYSRGFSADYDHALSKVVGECLERGPLLYFRMADMVRGSARALRASGQRIVEPSSLGVFAPWQVERRPDLAWDEDTVFRWTPCRSLLTSEEALVPSQLVFWNYARAFGDEPEPLLREQNTHGAGGWFSLEGAILSGLLECVQRDGFFRHWLRRIAPPRIDPAGVTRPETVRLVALARDVGLETLFFDITSELGVPTCLCALVRRDEEIPHLSMGASCRLDGETAIHDALLEAASVHHILGQTTERHRLPEGYEPYTDPAYDTPGRLEFWANPEHARHVEAFLSGPTVTVDRFCRGSVPGKDARSSLEHVVGLLRRAGVDAWYFEAQHPALDDLGYASVRVVVPGFVPMYCEDRNAPLGLARLRRPEDPASAPSRESWPPWPHPFP